MLHSKTFYTYWSKDRNEDTQDAALYTDDAFVVCDGVSQSFLPEQMSRALVSECLPAMTGGRKIGESIDRARGKYKASVTMQLERWAHLHPEGIPSHYLYHYLRGAMGGSTLIAGGFSRTTPRLHVTYVGDCNILVLDGKGRPYTTTPYDDENFPLAPSIISAQSGDVKLHTFSLMLPQHGSVIVTTDAMARYILDHIDDADFRSYLEECRSEVDFRKNLLGWWGQGLERDDITFLRYRFFYT